MEENKAGWWEMMMVGLTAGGNFEVKEIF